MKVWTTSLSLKLTIGFAAVIAVLGAGYMLLAVVSAKHFVQEVGQELNRHLASNIVHGYDIFEEGELQPGEARRLFNQLMVVNPNIELYIVGLDGAILSHAAPEGAVQMDVVAVEPIRQFIRGDNDRKPVRGDDPRNPGQQKTINVSWITEGSLVSGYLYIVIGSQAFDGIFDVLRDSYVMRLSILIALVTTVLSVAAAFILSAKITRRVGHLSQSVARFVADDFRSPLPRPAHGSGDEIDRLSADIETMSQRIVSQMKQLAQADANRRDLVANISHDLRTPIAAAQGHIETVLLRHPEIADDVRHHLERAKANGARLTGLIEQLFELARLDDPSMTLQPERFSIAELVHDVAQKHEIVAAEKKIQITVETPPAQAPVEADIGLIERLLDNLIGNAIKFVSPGGHVDLEVSDRAGNIRVAIADDGPGISVEDRSVVFQKHYRRRVGRDENNQGAGLGLAIAKKIVELHGG
ncbi:MAG: HAMP domain-containing sensor histidine kinase, partial [Alphaproteobacteria bacterium]|nr:HAMP domain-containing sensor histidine kinase [Alphaproteobacteria bacterium]